MKKVRANKMPVIQKRYTKKQISEAIQFWTKILENKSPLLDNLVDEYGYGIVFHNVPVNATLKLFNNIFDEIDECVFSNKLRKWPFVVDGCIMHCFKCTMWICSRPNF